MAMEQLKPLVLWEKPILSGGLLGTATAVFLVLKTVSVVTLQAYICLALVIVFTIWANVAPLIKKPPPPPIRIEIKESFVRDTAMVVSEKLKFGSAFVERVLAGTDLKLNGQVVVVLLVLSWIGSLASLFTLFYVSLVTAFTLPPVYKKYQHEIDDIVSHGRVWIEAKVGAIPGLIPKAEAAKKKE